MSLSNDSTFSYLERRQWRVNAFQWLLEKRQYYYLNLDSCLGELEENPANRDAALAAFWGVYLCDELPPVLEDLQQEKVKRLLEHRAQHDPRSTDISDLAFVTLHLAGLLAVCLIRPDWPNAENPSVVDILENAKIAYELSDKPESDVDDPPSWGKKLLEEDLFGFSTTLIGGIVQMELSLRRAEQGKYEEAFQLLNGAVWALSTTTFDNDSDQFTCFIPYLPHSGHRLDIKEAINIFEGIKVHARNIKSWEDVIVYCDVLRYLGFFDLYDSTIQVERPFIAEGLSVFEYWGRAVTFAEEQNRIVASPLPIITRDAIERMETRERLRRDFFGDLWEEIGKETQDILVDAEVDWMHSGMHSRLDNMVKEIRQLLEIMLVNIFPFLEYTIRQSDGHLIIWRIREAIEKNPEIRASIDGLKIVDHDKIWIKDELTKFLREVNHARNYFEKERHLPGKKPEEHQRMREKAVYIHNKLLGIGCEGVLLRLMRIKKAISSMK